MEIDDVYFDDLPEKYKGHVPNNGAGDKYANYLVVKHKGEIICVQSDAMEPEDSTFSRDLAWIKPLILEAYNLGVLEC